MISLSSFVIPSASKTSPQDPHNATHAIDFFPCFPRFAAPIYCGFAPVARPSFRVPACASARPRALRATNHATIKIGWASTTFSHFPKVSGYLAKVSFCPTSLSILWLFRHLTSFFCCCHRTGVGSRAACVESSFWLNFGQGP